jgi:hypothetical protein
MTLLSLSFRPERAIASAVEEPAFAARVPEFSPSVREKWILICSPNAHSLPTHSRHRRRRPRRTRRRLRLIRRRFPRHVFEKRPFLGGRASSWEHPGTGEVVDNCQHVLFRVCTNLDRVLPAHRRRRSNPLVRSNEFHRTRRPHLGHEVFPAARPAAHRALVPEFSFLSAADKFAIARALVPLTLTAQPDTGQSFQHWLDQHGQTKAAVERFWRPILVSALSEELDQISISAAAQVVRESMKSPAARHMGVPTVPLTDLYNAAGDYIRARGGELHFRQPVEGFTTHESHVQLQLRNQNQQTNPNDPEAGAPPLSRSLRTGWGL